MNQRHYVEVMDTVVWPWIEETYGDKDVVYCFQQVLRDARLMRLYLTRQAMICLLIFLVNGIEINNHYLSC